MDFSEVITDYTALGQHFLYRDGFVFTSISEPVNVFDAILIRNPSVCDAWSPKLGFSRKSLAEHIAFIQENQIKKAIIIAENIDFITACPSLNCLRIIPADTASSHFDYSPLYRMPEVRSLDCVTRYGGHTEHLSTAIDCLKINGLQTLYVRDGGFENYRQIKTLEHLYLSDIKTVQNMYSVSCSEKLKTLSFLSCGLRSLEGVERFSNLQGIFIERSRLLEDISALGTLSDHLRMLSVENCPKIFDFTSLERLEKLEMLTLVGSQTVPNLNFLSKMKNLKYFICTMNVADGDMTPCLAIPYVDMKNRKHYNIKNKDLPKKMDSEGIYIV